MRTTSENVWRIGTRYWYPFVRRTASNMTKMVTSWTTKKQHENIIDESMKCSKQINCEVPFPKNYNDAIVELLHIISSPILGAVRHVFYRSSRYGTFIGTALFRSDHYINSVHGTSSGTVI